MVSHLTRIPQDVYEGIEKRRRNCGECARHALGRCTRGRYCRRMERQRADAIGAILWRNTEVGGSRPCVSKHAPRSKTYTKQKGRPSWSTERLSRCRQQGKTQGWLVSRWPSAWTSMHGARGKDGHFLTASSSKSIFPIGNPLARTRPIISAPGQACALRKAPPFLPSKSAARVTTARQRNAP